MYRSIVSDNIHDDLTRAIELLIKYDIGAVEIHSIDGVTVEEFSLEKAKKYKQLLDEQQIKVSNLATTVFFMCKLKADYKISLFKPSFYVLDGDTVFAHLKALEHACQIAEIFDCELLRVFPFRWPDNYQVVGLEEDLKLIADNLYQATSIAEKYEKILVLENCPYSHCPKLEMTAKLVNMVDSPNLKLLYDPGNSYRAFVEKVPLEYQKLDVYQELEWLSENIYHLHWKNYSFEEEQEKPFVHKILSEGDLDFSLIYQLLQEKNYCRAISLEPEVEGEEVENCIIDLLNIVR